MAPFTEVKSTSMLQEKATECGRISSRLATYVEEQDPHNPIALALGINQGLGPVGETTPGTSPE